MDMNILIYSVFRQNPDWCSIICKLSIHGLYGQKLIKLLKGNIGQNYCCFGLGKTIFRYNTQSIIYKT